MFLCQNLYLDMLEENNDIHRQFTQAQIDELTAIYDDYLCIVRLHEQLLQENPKNVLAGLQMEDMFLGTASWAWTPMPITDQEKQEFADCINNYVYGGENKAYVVLQHIKSEENVVERPIFAIPPFVLKGKSMELPSSIERYFFIFSKNASLGKTEFYIDGRYKMVYTDDIKKDESIMHFLFDKKTLTEFFVTVNMTERFLKNEDIFEDDFTNVLATEKIVSNENTILETLASFVEKFQNILCDRYNLSDGDKAFKKAEQEGLIDSADAFQDYMNIRHLLRHQWDTLDGFGSFSAEKNKKNVLMRTKYINSYLKLCDVYNDTIIQRKKSYINILYQMQRIISAINPNRMIRGISESNSKFTQRARAKYQENKNIEIELNEQLLDKKQASLNRTMNKLLPQANVIDNSVKMNDRIDDINYYLTRSWFLEMVLSVECEIMKHCLMRGHNFKKVDAWEYLKNIGVLSQTEFDKWQNYIQLRNLLSHNYFGEHLRNMLHQIEDDFDADIENIDRKVIAIRGPGVGKCRDKVFKFAHKDGLFVFLDFNNYKISTITKMPRIHKHRKMKTKTEIYPNGIEFTLSSKQIICFKNPLGVNINLCNQTIKWDDNTSWTKKGKIGYVLKTKQNMLITDNKLQVIKFMENDQPQRVSKYGDLLLDSQHKLSLDVARRIKDFEFKTDKGDIIKAVFNHAKCGYNTIVFDDGTCVLQSGPECVITHGNKTLMHDSREDFMATYNAIQDFKIKGNDYVR